MRQATLTLRQRRDLGPILRDAFAYYARDWRGFAAIGSATIPFALAGSAISLAISDPILEQVALLGFFLVSLVPAVLVEGAVIAYVEALDAGRDEHETAAFARSLRRARPLIGSSARMAAVCFPLAVTVIGLPVAVFFFIRWVFAPQHVILEGSDAVNALRSSAALTAGRWWVTFGRVAVVGLLIVVVNMTILSLIVSASYVLYALVSAIIGAFTAPYFSIALTLMYFDLKLRKAEEALPA
ncbi:MAG TPA: hypothetical protein VNN10_06045 [Dehalococcoidia bacterium]|nr:hypothetical protein [Dehalococcoidia bacterium]